MKHLIVCERCNTEMKPGKAIASSEEEGVIYCWIPYAYWPDVFMDVMKCPSCGSSLSYNEIERREKRKPVYVWFSVPDKNNRVAVAATDHEHMAYARSIGTFKSKEDGLAKISELYPNKKCIIMSPEENELNNPSRV